MFGTGVTGGITGVVNDWVEAGITKYVNLEYISTLNDIHSSKLTKLIVAVVAYYKLLIKSFGSVDIVHIHLASNMSFYRKLIIFIIAKLCNIKTVVHLHGSEFKDFYNNSWSIQKELISYMYNKASAIIVLSESWRSFVSSISSNENIHIIYNGASIKKFQPKEKNNTSITILFMGRLGNRKGVYELLQSFKKLFVKVPQTLLLLGGDGEIEKVQHLVKKMELSEHIKVLGWVSGKQKIDLYGIADIFVLPSYNEGLPVSILEAMASGLPIVSTPVGGIAEAVINEKNGYLVQPGDVEALYKRLLDLCMNSELRETMGKESRCLVSSKFNLEDIVIQVTNVYDLILQN